MRKSLTLASLALLTALGQAQTVIDHDHTDVGVTYDADLGVNGLGMNVGYDPTESDYEASDVLLKVYDNSLEARPSGLQFNFIGNSAGDNTWIIPQSLEPDKLYLGIGMDSFEDNPPPFAKYVQSDPRFNTTTSTAWVGVQLMSFSGPGQVATWTNEVTGPRVLFATNDGIGASDYVLTPSGGDNHFNWAFTAAGKYDLTFQASAYLDNGNGTSTLIKSPLTTYHFDIGGQPVPEPTSIAAVGLGLLGVLRRRRRKA